jgi:pteridine reductase
VTATPDLRGRVALVTGGAVRLGRAIVLELARRGAHVAFTYRTSEARARELVEELRAIQAPLGTRALAVRCDLTGEADVDAAFERVDAELGRLDLLVNNAAIFERTPFREIGLDAWQRHLDVNLTGGFLCAKRAGDRMLAGKGGVIVNIACAGGLRPWASHLAYCVSKAGVVMMTQVLARALAPSVRVNAIAPGPVLMPEAYGDDERARAVEATVLRRPGSPEDVVRAVLFCWESTYTTGAVIPVDGGRSIL